MISRASEADAIKAVERVEFRCRSQIDYFDYVNLVKDAEFELSRVASGPVKNSLNRALGHYLYAVKLWDWRTAMRNRSPSAYAGQNFFKDYPGTDKPVSRGGVLHDENENFFSIDAAILHVWFQASAALRDARKEP
jgi:hypothetical protein